MKARKTDFTHVSSPKRRKNNRKHSWIISHFIALAPRHIFNVLIALFKGRYTLVTLPRIVKPNRDSVDGTRDLVTYQKLVTR